MRLLWRIGLFFIALGFLGGFLLRRAWGGRRLPELLLVSFLPWLVHLVYALSYVVRRFDGVTLGVPVVGLLSVGVAFALLRFSPRFYRPDPRRAAAVPLVLALLHGLLLSVWVGLNLRPQGVTFATIPNLYFAAATLSVSAGLLGYAVAPFGERRPVPKRRR